MLVKSSAESIELAFNTAEYCCKKLFKSEKGGRYNKWYCYGVEFGQDYAWFKVEHTDYSVRLSFEFMDTGFVYVDGYFTNGSSYDKKTITSWRFDSESEDVAADKVKDVLDRFFDEGINVLRGEEVMNSRRAIKSGTSIKEYASFKIDDSVKINSPKRGPYKNGKTGIVVGFYKGYDGEILISVQLDEGGLMDFSKDELENLGDSGYHITYLDSSRKPIKSANYNGFNLEARRSYGKGNGYFTTYPVWDTDLDTSIGAIEYHYAVENPYYVAWVYDDFGANKTGRTKAFDTEEECLEWIGEELASGTTARDKLLKYWEELGYDYKSKNLNNSRKPVKSDWKREAEFMNDRIRDDNLLYQVFKIEDEHFGGNFENPDNWDGTHIVYTIENGEITNTEIVDSFEDVIDDGNKYYLSANRDTGYRNTDYVLDRVALWQERNNRGITSSRKPVKSSFIVGKQDSGTKVYFCEDGKYYSENDYSRPSIKIFNSKQEADKIAKRSKSGFVSPLEK